MLLGLFAAAAPNGIAETADTSGNRDILRASLSNQNHLRLDVFARF